MKNNAESPMSACDVLTQMLAQGPQWKEEITRHIGDFGISGGANLVYTPRADERTRTLEEDTNALLRTQIACERNLLVGPYSEPGHMQYVNQATYGQQLEKKQAEEVREKELEALKQAIKDKRRQKWGF